LFQAGTTNPTIDLFIVDLATISRRQLEVPLDVVSNDHILGTVFWVNDQALGAIWLNRRQNRGVFVTYDASSFAMSKVSCSFAFMHVCGTRSCAISKQNLQNCSLFFFLSHLQIMEINEPNGWINVNTPKCDANSVCYFVDNFNNWPTLTSVDTKNKEDVKRLSATGKTVISLNGIQGGAL
jgi:hypothetical protein